MDANEAPTFNGLNKPQRRALILREELRFHDNRHLDTFIEGISAEEPPAYMRHNGTVYPPLTEVKLKESATRFDFGNVHFDTDVILGTGVFHAWLVVEDGRFELRTDEPLPPDDQVIESVPIHAFIAKQMAPLFEQKFRAIWARKNQINEIRQVAFNLADSQPADEFRAGETLASLNPKRTARNGPSQEKSKERRPGDPVVKHSANKRKRVGLDSIPEKAKAAVFDHIPDQTKVDFFNNVTKLAFSNFDNLMIASWNVVSVYSNVGTDFPDLHKSIVELKSVLQDFEDSVEKSVTRTEPKFRRDFAPADGMGEGKSEQPTPDSTQDGTSDAAGCLGGADTSARQQDGVDAFFNEPAESVSTSSQLAMPSPPKPQTDLDTSPKHERRSSIFLSHHSTVPPPLLHSPFSSSRPSPTPSRKRPLESFIDSASACDNQTSELQRFRPEYRASSSEEAPLQRIADMSLLELSVLYKAKKAQFQQEYGENRKVPGKYRGWMKELAAEIKGREEGMQREKEVEEDVPKFLGNSVLGEKRTLGRAPVAVMGGKMDGRKGEV